MQKGLFSAEEEQRVQGSWGQMGGGFPIPEFVGTEGKEGEKERGES